MNRLVIVQVAAELLHQILSQGTRATKIAERGLPEDAVLVAVAFDGRTISLTYQSDSFNVVAQGEPIPHRDPVFFDATNEALNQVVAGVKSINEIREYLGLPPIDHVISEEVSGAAA